jgi:hypothetical protein
MVFNFKILAILFIFILGLIYYSNSRKVFENLSNNTEEKKPNNYRCPNMLIEKDGKILLFNSKLAFVPGVNPVQFNSLEEYSEFIEWQKSQNINCPVLYLQYTTDTQNNDLLQIKPSIFENSGGLSGTKSNTLQGKTSTDYFEKNKMLDATLDSTPNSKIKFNTGMYSGFDQYNQNVGLDTPLDFLYNEKTSQSRNPMDPNWGGKEYTKKALQDGDYKGREVYKYNTPQVKTNFTKILND